VAPSQPTVRTPSKPTVKQRIVRKKKVHKVQPLRTRLLRTVVPPNRPRSSVAAVRTSSKLGSQESFGFAWLLFVATLGLAIVCLGVAAMPAAYVPWRPAAYFVAGRHLDLTIAGLALLFAAGFAWLVGGGL
jgi:hypothetical protein